MGLGMGPHCSPDKQLMLIFLFRIQTGCWTSRRFKRAKMCSQSMDRKWNGEFHLVDAEPLHLLIVHNVTFVERVRAHACIRVCARLHVRSLPERIFKECYFLVPGFGASNWNQRKYSIGSIWPFRKHQRNYCLPEE